MKTNRIEAALAELVREICAAGMTPGDAIVVDSGVSSFGAYKIELTTESTETEVFTQIVLTEVHRSVKQPPKGEPR